MIFCAPTPRAQTLAAKLWDRAQHTLAGLRVWNDDDIAPGSGFPPHPHAIWKSSPMFGRARLLTRQVSAIAGVLEVNGTRVAARDGAAGAG